MKRFANWATKLGAGVGALCLVSCASTDHMSTAIKEPFGQADGKPVELYTLRNSKGAEAKIMTYGGIVQSLKMPDRSGKFDDIVLGYDHLAGYVKETPYFGATASNYTT
jgi:aldose 1-epimerase